MEKKPNRLCRPVGTGGGGCWRRVEICVTRIVTRILRGKPLIWLIWLTPQKNGSRQSTQPDWSLDWGPSLPINISAKDSRDLAFKRLTVTKNRSSNFDSFYSGRQWVMLFAKRRNCFGFFNILWGNFTSDSSSPPKEVGLPTPSPFQIGLRWEKHQLENKCELYQLRVDVGMLNTVKIYWADVSSVSASCCLHTLIKF